MHELLKMIRFGDLDFGHEERKAIIDLIYQEDPQLSMGKNVYAFEKKFAEWVGSRYAVMVNSGTSADLVAILAGKQVFGYPDKYLAFTTSITYPAVWNAIKLSGFDIMPLDVEQDTLSVNLLNSPAYYTDYPFVPVHTFGKMCKGINTANVLVEDACEALGCKYKNKNLGCFGQFGTFSFQVAHSITTIEGGMVVTDNNELYDALRSIRDNGRICTCPVCTLKVSGVCSKRSENDEVERRWITKYVGGNFKPTEIQGVLGLVKMQKIDKNLARRREIYLKYEETFHNLTEDEGEYIVPMVYPVKVKNMQKAVAELEKAGIECRGMLPSYSEQFPNATKVSKTFIQIPLYPKLTDENVEYIVSEVKKYV